MLDYSPLGWEEFFERKQLVQPDDSGDQFNVYLKGAGGPLFYLLHGGGYTGLSFACFAEQLSAQINCQIMAPDLREHGETVVVDKGDLSAERMINDICLIYRHFYGSREKAPPMFLIGHSMGGALAIRVAAASLLPNIQVVAAIDVVEGSAMASLHSMHRFLASRPQSFDTVEKAIEWCVRNKVTSNLRAARVSMPSRLCQSTDSANNKPALRWRTRLEQTESHWRGWFTGLSALFLQCPAVKVLVLAGVDRLDKELLTGQMRGQFQLEVLHKVGHAVHEDSPELVAKIFVQIVSRYKAIFREK